MPTLRIRGAISLLLHTSAWRGAYLSTKDHFTFLPSFWPTRRAGEGDRKSQYRLSTSRCSIRGLPEHYSGGIIESVLFERVTDKQTTAVQCNIRRRYIKSLKPKIFYVLREIQSVAQSKHISLQKPAGYRCLR